MALLPPPLYNTALCVCFIETIYVYTYRNGVGSHDVTLDPLPVVLVTVLGCLGWWPTDDRLFGSWFTLNVCLTFRSEPVAAVCETHTRQETFTHESGYCCSYGSSENTARPPEFHRVWNGISCVWKRNALG